MIQRYTIVAATHRHKQNTARRRDKLELRSRKERERKGGSKRFVVVVVAVLVRALVYANVGTVSFLKRKLVLVSVSEFA